MELQVFGKNLEITDTIEAYINKRLLKLTRYLSVIDDAKAEIKEEKTKSPSDRFTVQITVKSKNIILRGEEKGVNVNTAVDNVVEILARQIKRYKGKLQKKGRGTSLVRQSSTSDDANAVEMDTVLSEVVKVKHFMVQSMSVEEAIEQMELLSHDFFLFAGSDTGALSLVYKRKEGNYGLIEPELT